VTEVDDAMASALITPCAVSIIAQRGGKIKLSSLDKGLLLLLLVEQFLSLDLVIIGVSNP